MTITYPMDTMETVGEFISRYEGEIAGLFEHCPEVLWSDEARLYKRLDPYGDQFWHYTLKEAMDAITWEELEF